AGRSAAASAAGETRTPASPWWRQIGYSRHGRSVFWLEAGSLDDRSPLVVVGLVDVRELGRAQARRFHAQRLELLAHIRRLDRFNDGVGETFHRLLGRFRRGVRGVPAGALDGVAQFAEGWHLRQFTRATCTRGRKHAQLAGFVLRGDVGYRAHEGAELAAQQVRDGRGAALVADVVHVDARGGGEQQREEVRQAARARRGVIAVLAVLLYQRHVVLQRGRR